MRSLIRCSSAAAAALCLALPAAQATVNVSIDTEFNWLDDGMPASLEIGQAVTLDFSYDETVAGQDFTGYVQYEDALTAFSFDVPEAPFSGSGLSGDVFDNGDDTLTFTAHPVDTAYTLDGQNLTSVEVVLLNPSGSVTAAEYGLPTGLDGWALDSWTMNFYPPGSGSSSGVSHEQVPFTPVGPGSSWGVIVTNIPEPSAYAALAGLGALALALYRRRRA